MARQARTSASERWVTAGAGIIAIEVSTAMIAVLGLDRDGLVRVSGTGHTTRWETSVIGERQLGVRIRVA